MGKAKDLTGQKFGKLTAQEPTNVRSSSGMVSWKCICDCSNVFTAYASSLTTGHTKSCGLCPRVKDLTGFKNGRLTVLEMTNEKIGNDTVWKCICDCGNITKVSGNHLKSELHSTKSCGCLVKENNKKLFTTHGMHNTSTYKSWTSMLERCNNRNTASYSYYGGGGITICDRWLNSFENFYADMGDKPSNEYSLDRIDSDGNYEPCNCKWSTDLEQANNRRNNVIINYNDKNYTRGELAKEHNLPTNILAGRLRNNWPVDIALKTPIRNSKGN